MSSTAWPVHPQPLPDELFSSWMARAAAPNGENFTRFVRLTAPIVKDISKSIDNFLPATVIESVSRKMNTPSERVYQTTLDSYVGYVCENRTEHTHHKYNILNSGETRAMNFFQQFCPRCLSEGIPYYRRKWRVSFVTVCTKHCCILEDRCPQCLSPVLIMNNKRHDQHKPFVGPVSMCHCCLFDLSSVETKPADELVVEDTKLYLKALKSGYYQLNDRQWIYSFSMFLVLRHFIRVFVERSDELTGLGRTDADTFTTAIRYTALSHMKGIFKNWPTHFINYCQSDGVNYSLITPIEKVNAGSVPFFVDEAIKPYAYSRTPEPTIESVMCAKSIMERRGIRVNIVTLNQFMGYHDSRVITNFMRNLRRPHA